MKTMATVKQSQRFEVGDRVEYMGSPALLSEWPFSRGERRPAPADLTQRDRTFAVNEDYLDSAG